MATGCRRANRKSGSGTRAQRRRPGARHSTAARSREDICRWRSSRQPASPSGTVPSLAVGGLSFTVEAGEARSSASSGPNGAGKTTALRMLVGLVRPDSGSATICGRTYADLTAPAAKVGAVFEASGFHPGRTAPEPPARAGLAVRRRRSAHRRRAGARRSQRCRATSGSVRYSLGMRQRLGLATALLADPDVLILDEPANGLDPRACAGCEPCCGTWRRTEPRCWCRATISPRSRRPRTRSSSSAAGAWSPRDRSLSSRPAPHSRTSSWALPPRRVTTRQPPDHTGGIEMSTVIRMELLLAHHPPELWPAGDGGWPDNPVPRCSRRSGLARRASRRSLPQPA